MNNYRKLALGIYIFVQLCCCRSDFKWNDENNNVSWTIIIIAAIRSRQTNEKKI